MRVKPQYCSFKNLDRLSKVEGSGRAALSGAKGKVAHLALHASRVTAVAAGDNPLLENLVQRAFMKSLSVPRGEWQRKSSSFAEPLAPSAQTITGLDLREHRFNGHQRHRLG